MTLGEETELSNSFLLLLSGDSVLIHHVNEFLLGGDPVPSLTILWSISSPAWMEAS